MPPIQALSHITPYLQPFSHYLEILNFFDRRSTNASAESFNAKLKAFGATLN